MANFPLFKAHLPTAQAVRRFEEVLNSGYVNEGVQVTELEGKLKKYLGDGVVLLNSCTSALHLALHLAGVRSGDDVVTTPMTCVASNTSIHARGANIVWADIDPNTGMLTSKTVEAALTPKTRAVVYVAWAGGVGDLLRTQFLCSERGIPLILDAAHAFGTKLIDADGPVPISDFVDYTCYSFQAIKHFTTGDGGAIVCPSEEKRRARRLRWFGLDRDIAKDEKGDWKGQQWDADILEAGYKFNMNNLSAALGLAQLDRIDDILETHRANAALYDRLFEGTSVSPVGVPQQSELTSRWVYTVRTPLRDAAKMGLISRLNREGIAAGLVHVPNDAYTCFASSKKELPGVAEFSATQFSLPCGWWLGSQDVGHIAVRVLELLGERTRS